MNYFINDIPADLNQLAAFCVEFCGGGYNENQTAEAMLMNAEIGTIKPDEPKEYIYRGRTYLVRSEAA